jgi:hypothetical protein
MQEQVCDMGVGWQQSPSLAWDQECLRTFSLWVGRVPHPNLAPFARLGWGFSNPSGPPPTRRQTPTVDARGHS